jgi:hypothetical protein
MAHPVKDSKPEQMTAGWWLLPSVVAGLGMWVVMICAALGMIV